MAFAGECMNGFVKVQVHLSDIMSIFYSYRKYEASTDGQKYDLYCMIIKLNLIVIVSEITEWFILSQHTAIHIFRINTVYK